MIEQAFRLIDKNGNGVLSRTEVIKAVRTNQSVRNILGLGGVGLMVRVWLDAAFL